MTVGEGWNRKPGQSSEAPFHIHSLPWSSSGTCSPGKEANGHVFPHWTLSHAEVDGEHTAAPLMGVGTGWHGTLPGLKWRPTLGHLGQRRSDAGLVPTSTRHLCAPGSVTYPEKSLSAGSHDSLPSTSHCLCAQLAQDSPPSFCLDPGCNCLVLVKIKYEFERRGLTLLCSSFLDRATECSYLYM